MSKNFKEIAKKFSLLYMGLEKCTCHDYLEDVFKVVYSGNKDSYDVFEMDSIDMVFIDIDNQDFDWVDTIDVFREYMYDIPVVILTSLEDRSIFKKAIKAGVTQVIFKPINQEELYSVIHDIVYKLQDKLEAKDSYYKKQLKTQSSMALKSLSSVVDVINSPMIVVSEENIVYVNKNIYELFTDKEIVLSKKPKADELRKIVENFSEDMRVVNIPYGKSFGIKYHYQSKNIKKVFFPSKYKIELEGYKDSFVVIFTDIAPLLMQTRLLNYQKNKIESYKNLVEELLVKQVFKDNKKSIIKKLDISTTKKEDLYDESNSIDDHLEAKDIVVLRRDSSFKVTAKEYIDDLDSSLYDEVTDLSELEQELQVIIDAFVITPTKEHTLSIAKLFLAQGGVIISLIDFVDLGNAVCSLSDFLEDITQEQIDKKHQEMNMMLENILQDLVQWRENIFVRKETLDIHYLDASLLSSILQFQVGIVADHNEDSGELELF